MSDTNYAAVLASGDFTLAAKANAAWILACRNGTIGAVRNVASDAGENLEHATERWALDLLARWGATPLNSWGSKFRFSDGSEISVLWDSVQGENWFGGLYP